MSHKKVTKISVMFRGIKKRARKVCFHSEKLNEIYSEAHETLTSEQFNEYERKAWRLLDDLGYKQVTTGQITVTHGEYDQGVLSLYLPSKQHQLILRGKQ